MIGYYDSPIGTLLLEERGGAVIRIVRVDEKNIPAEDSETILRLKAALDRYFAGEREDFSVPLDPEGTVFQKKIWAELRNIPYGQTASYRQVAERACGSARYARAAASAAHRNPILIAVPCHRMISADGSLGGFALGIDAKKYLLALER